MTVEQADKAVEILKEVVAELKDFNNVNGVIYEIK